MFEGQYFRVSQQMSDFVGDIFVVAVCILLHNGRGSIFGGKIFVHKLQTTKSTQIFPLKITCYTVSTEVCGL